MLTINAASFSCNFYPLQQIYDVVQSNREITSDPLLKSKHESKVTSVISMGPRREDGSISSTSISLPLQLRFNYKRFDVQKVTGRDAFFKRLRDTGHSIPQAHYKMSKMLSIVDDNITELGKAAEGLKIFQVGAYLHFEDMPVTPEQLEQVVLLGRFTLQNTCELGNDLNNLREFCEQQPNFKAEQKQMFRDKKNAKTALCLMAGMVGLTFNKLRK